jgi:hypothetical protein
MKEIKCIDYKAVSNRRTNWSTCNSCSKDFEPMQRRNEWRLLLPRTSKYLSGMFWTIQCDKCFEETVGLWAKELTDIYNELREK